MPASCRASSSQSISPINEQMSVSCGLLSIIKSGVCPKERGGVVSELRRHLEALESAREFMLIKIERGEAHHINHRVVGALDKVIQDLMIEVDIIEEEA